MGVNLTEVQGSYRATKLEVVLAEDVLERILKLKPGDTLMMEVVLNQEAYNDLLDLIDQLKRQGKRYDVTVSNQGIMISRES